MDINGVALSGGDAQTGVLWKGVAGRQGGGEAGRQGGITGGEKERQGEGGAGWRVQDEMGQGKGVENRDR